jgi:hypothetical protein
MDIRESRTIPEAPALVVSSRLIICIHRLVIPEYTLSTVNSTRRYMGFYSVLLRITVPYAHAHKPQMRLTWSMLSLEYSPGEVSREAGVSTSMLSCAS